MTEEPAAEGDEPEMLDDPAGDPGTDEAGAEETESDTPGEDAEEPEMRDEPDAEAGDSNDPPANDEETDAAGAAEAEAEPRQAA